MRTLDRVNAVIYIISKRGVMEIFYQVLSIIGIAGIIGVGIWVGFIQTKIVNYDDMKDRMETDHDLLIRLDEKMNLVLKKLGI